MPEFELTAVCRAPPVEVFKLLHDPSRIPEWWAGTDRIESDGEGGVTRYASEWPEFPYPLGMARADGAVTISCLVSEISYEWRLVPHADGCAVRARVELPEDQEDRLGAQRAEVGASLDRLVRVAEEEFSPC